MEQLEKEARDTPLAPGPLDAADFTSKKIDAFIHGRKIQDKAYKCSHYEHQLKILSVVEGKEKEIFNDAYFKYPIRKALNGITGRMCSILTSCYFNLYDELLKKGLSYDFVYTLKFMYNILFHIELNKENTKFRIPTVEFRAIQSILQRVKRDFPKSPIFQEAFWKRYIEILDEKVALARTKEWFMDPTRSDEQKWGSMLGYIKENEMPFIFYGSYDEGMWEYYPCYISNNNTIKFSNYKEHVALMRNMFLTPESIENEDIQCDPSSCMKSGGKRRKRKTRKPKRRTLKKRSNPT